MSSKKWLVTFLLSVILVAGSYALFNIAVDPFGVFGDRIYHWFSYDFTNNPRIAKIVYLDQHHEEYDSYIIGSSATSSFPADTLNRYFDAKFYNMLMYGSDMMDVENTSVYIVENYHPKNIVLNINISSGQHYGNKDRDPTNSMHTKAGGQSFLPFYLQYMFLTPQYSMAKIKAKEEDSFLPDAFDVFNAETGAYDKRVRDVEPISDIESYLKNYPIFADYPSYHYEMDKITETVESVKRIKALCEENQINFVVTCSPVYVDYYKFYTEEDIVTFYSSLAEATDFWDFSMSQSISTDPRYFYDESHFRNDVGNMMLARMFGDDSIYIPEDFGYYATQDNVAEHIRSYFDDAGNLRYNAYLSDDPNTEEDAYGAETVSDMPILMYHHLSDDANDSETITPQLFEAQIEALFANGYTAVSFDEVIAYVERGEALPPKPILITFDDGYMSNYTYAYPILQKYQMKATIFIIGSTFGEQKHYKDTDYPITPHFGYEEAREMLASGLISIQSHTFDMHQWPPYETSEPIRENILKLEDESETDYINAMTEDFSQISDLIEEISGIQPTVCAFPYGVSDTLSQYLLQSFGIKVTLSTESGKNTFVKGLSQSLLNLKRYNMCEDVSVDDLLTMLAE